MVSLRPNISVAYLNANYLKLDCSNDPLTGDLLLTPTANSTTTFQVNQADSTNVLTVDTTNKGFQITGATSLIADVATSIPLLVKGAASQSANLQEWQNSDATVLASMSNLGKLTLKGEAYNPGLVVSPGNNAGAVINFLDSLDATRGYVQVWNGGNVTINATSVLALEAASYVSVNTDLRVGDEVQTGGNFWIGAVAYATAGTPVKDSERAIMTGWAWNGSNGYTLRTDLNLFLTKDDYVSGNGTFKCSISDYYATLTPVVWQVNQDGTFTHIINNAAAVGLIVKGAASQSANLLEIQDSAGAVLSGVDERGILFSDGGIDVNSIFIGSDAGKVGATGTYNIGIGIGVLDAATTTIQNVGIGGFALSGLTTGAYNVAIGYQAGINLTEGERNMFVGTRAGERTTTGNQNMAIGTYAFRYNVTGGGNVAIGDSAGGGNSPDNSFSYTVFIGSGAGYVNEGNYNTGIGRTSLVSVTSGTSNTAIGGNSGWSLTTGSTNIFLGMNAGYRQTTLSNLLIIDNQLRADVATEITNSILYGVMASAPANQTLRINAVTSIYGGGDIGDGTNKTVIEADGTIKFEGTATVFKDLQFAISNAKVPAANFPTWETFTANTNEYGFAVDDYIDTQANETPHSWKLGSTGHVHAHITTKAANATGSNRFAKFTVVVAYADTGEAWQEATLTAELTIPDGTAVLEQFYLDMGNLTLTNFVEESEIRCRITRIAATGGTEYSGNIFITQIGIHLENDTIGFRTETTK